MDLIHIKYSSNGMAALDNSACDFEGRLHVGTSLSCSSTSSSNILRVDESNNDAETEEPLILG